MHPWRGRCGNLARVPRLRGHNRVLSVTALVLALLAGGAGAQHDTIERVRSTKGPLEERLSAELSTLGFDVKDVESKNPDADLEQVALAQGAAAAVRLQKDGSIELWVGSPHGTEPPLHETIGADARRDWNLTAVSALEALRAHLLRFRPRMREPLPVPAEPPVVSPPSVPSPATRRLWLVLAGGAEASAGGLGTSAEIVAELRFEPRPWLDVSGFGVLGPFPAQLEGREGVASVRQELAGVAVDAQSRLAGAHVSLGLGAAIAELSMKGQPASGYAGEEASIVTAGPVLRSCASIDVTPVLRLRAELTGGVTAPHAVIRFAGREVAEWGRPFGLLTLGLEWGAL
jgi:hypothetical protein